MTSPKTPSKEAPRKWITGEIEYPVNGCDEMCNPIMDEKGSFKVAKTYGIEYSAYLSLMNELDKVNKAADTYIQLNGHANQKIKELEKENSLLKLKLEKAVEYGRSELEQMSFQFNNLKYKDEDREFILNKIAKDADSFDWHMKKQLAALEEKP